MAVPLTVPLTGFPNFNFENLPTAPGNPYDLSNISPTLGHNDVNFNSSISAFYGTVGFMYKAFGRQITKKCKTDCDWETLINGAVSYNGGGNPNYRAEIEEALNLSGCR